MTAGQKLAAGLAAVGLVAWALRPKGLVVTTEVFDLPGLGNTLDASPQVKAFAEAIAKAEGFHVANSVPDRANNPGNLKVGQPALDSGISVFDSENEGWARLYRQLQLIIDGESRVYTLDDTISTMSQKWTATVPDQASWAQTVSSRVGATPDTPLWQVLL